MGGGGAAVGRPHGRCACSALGCGLPGLAQQNRLCGVVVERGAERRAQGGGGRKEFRGGAVSGREGGEPAGNHHHLLSSLFADVVARGAQSPPIQGAREGSEREARAISASCGPARITGSPGAAGGREVPFFLFLGVRRGGERERDRGRRGALTCSLSPSLLRPLARVFRGRSAPRLLAPDQQTISTDGADLTGDRPAPERRRKLLGSCRSSGGGRFEGGGKSFDRRAARYLALGGSMILFQAD